MITGKGVRQRTVPQETTKYKAGILPLNIYERTQPIGEKLQFDTPSADHLNVNQLGETSAVEANLDENQLDEYSDGTDSSDMEVNIDEEIENDLSFLKTTRSGRSITINGSLY